MSQKSNARISDDHEEVETGNTNIKERDTNGSKEKKARSSLFKQ